jgi:hypothetical protein
MRKFPHLTQNRELGELQSQSGSEKFVKDTQLRPVIPGRASSREPGIQTPEQAAMPSGFRVPAGAERAEAAAVGG